MSLAGLGVAAGMRPKVALAVRPGQTAGRCERRGIAASEASLSSLLGDEPMAWLGET